MSGERVLPGVDVVVIGGGGAGVTSAVTAQQLGASVLLLSKEPIGGGDTRISDGYIAQPGVAAGDGPERFAEDILRSGEGLSRPDLVRVLASEAAHVVPQYESIGVTFERDEEGRLSDKVLRTGGGHSVRRSRSCPARGVAIGSALRMWVARAGVVCREGALAFEIIVHDGELAGVRALDLASGEIVAVPCRAVVLATGSSGWLYAPHTDSVRACTGDGYALALLAGARLVDMEQVQFLPFGYAFPRSILGTFLGDCTVAGPHGVVRDGRGEIFLPAGVDKMSRAPVVRAIAGVISDPARRGPHGGVFFDPSENWQHDDSRQTIELLVRRDFFGLARRGYGEQGRMGKLPIEVLPTAHYQMGGVLASTTGSSSVPQLYAAGAAMGGLHGGNRLASCGLAESVVFGRRVGRAAAESALKARRIAAGLGGAGSPVLPAPIDAGPAPAEAYLGRRGSLSPATAHATLQQIMWERVGVARTADSLTSALSSLDQLAREPVSVPAARVYNTHWRDALELRHMLVCARAIAASALAREETRGAHLRIDRPERWAVAMHMIAQLTEGSIRVDRQPVPVEVS